MAIPWNEEAVVLLFKPCKAAFDSNLGYIREAYGCPLEGSGGGVEMSRTPFDSGNMSELLLPLGRNDAANWKIGPCRARARVDWISI